MTPAELSQAIRAAVQSAVSAGDLTLEVPSEVRVERPRNREHGDYATNIAMQLAKAAGRSPREIAQAIAAQLAAEPGIKSVDIAGPGFLNITLDAAAQGELARAIVLAGDSFGRSDALHGQRIDVEFISANPTGPLHLGHTRWAAVGDALARVLAAAGAEVVREFYINDRGAQMDRFAASLEAAALGQPVPEDGYHGDYVPHLAQQIVAEVPGILDLPEGERFEAFREEGYRRQLRQQQQVLEDFRTRFDVWYSERWLYGEGRVEHAIDKLRGLGHLYEADGALWMRTTDFGDDRDRVLIRSNGEPTYFASDAAYYVDKRERGFDVCLYLLGADHHGYVGRLKAIAACAGDDPSKTLDVLIGQLVKILRGGEEVRLSKRAGEIVTLEDFVEVAGLDAVRYSLCRYPTDSPLVLDLDVITRQSNDNPVYYVQYAHARLSRILANAAELGIDRGSADDFRPELLEHDRESDLLGALGEFPRVVAQAAELREPHRVARYLEELASAFHKFYDECRVLPRGDEEVTDVMRARLWLVDATRVVLRNGLGLLGVSAPERM
ncbi:MAG: arginine--tRNA ligase [Actinomycetales bacterium]